jgi:hypothetical protein
MNLVRSIDRSLRELDEMERMLGLFPLRVERISAWSVGQQIEHIIVVGDSILEALAAQKSSERAKPLTFVGRIVLFSGFIPRGRGRSPEKLRPSGISVEELRSRLQQYRNRLVALRAALSEIASNPARFNHPFFGSFNARQWVRFLDVHQHHHVKIVRDIAGAAVVESSRSGRRG